MSLGLLLTEKNFFLKKVQNWARPVHFFKSLSRIFLKILKLFNSSKLFFNLVENSILRNIKMGTLLLKPLFWAVGDIFKGSGVGELGAGSIWPERILTNPSCWVSFQCSFIHWIHWRYFQGWKNNLQVHRGVYFTSSSPPPLGVGEGGWLFTRGRKIQSMPTFSKN